MDHGKTKQSDEKILNEQARHTLLFGKNLLVLFLSKPKVLDLYSPMIQKDKKSKVWCLTEILNMLLCEYVRMLSQKNSGYDTDIIHENAFIFARSITSIS